MRPFKEAGIILVSLVVSACTKTTENESPLISRGKAVYNSTCIACHNLDPRKDGALGPAIAGSSQALIEARVLHLEYPPGYKPKRETRMMLALPQVKDDIPALAAYLNNF